MAETILQKLCRLEKANKTPSEDISAEGKAKNKFNDKLKEAHKQYETDLKIAKEEDKKVTAKAKALIKDCIKAATEGNGAMMEWTDVGHFDYRRLEQVHTRIKELVPGIHALFFDYENDGRMLVIHW